MSRSILDSSTSLSARYRIRCTNPSRVALECEQCGAKWSPMLGAGGRLPVGWWGCPHRCNWRFEDKP